MTSAIPKPTPAIASGHGERDDARRRRELPIDEQEPEPGEAAADHHRHLRAHPRGPAARGEAGHDHRHRQRGEDERDLVPCEVRDQLQVERSEEEDREDREVRGEGDDVRGGEGRIAEELEPHNRVRRPPLDRDEGDDEDGGEDEEPVDPPSPVTAVLAADHGERRGSDRARSGDETRDVELASFGILALGERDGGDPERERAEPEAEPEDAAPAGPVRQHAADHRAEGEREPRDGRPHTQSAGPLRPLRVDVPDERERPRLGGRRADAHHEPAGDEDARGRRNRRNDGAGAEDDDAGEHHLLPPEQVAERPAGEHQRREREHVAVDDPLQVADAGAERRLDVGERDADDRVVEEGEEEDRAEGRQGGSSRVTLPEQRDRAHAEDVTACRRTECCPGARRACRGSRTRPSRCRSGAPRFRSASGAPPSRA